MTPRNENPKRPLIHRESVRGATTLVLLAALLHPAGAVAKGTDVPRPAVDPVRAQLSRLPNLKGAGLVFASTPNLAIPDGAYIGIDDGNDGFGEDAGMACDTINTAGHTGSEVLDVIVRLKLSHGWIGDLIVKLRNPSGDILTILNRPGEPEPVDDGVSGGFGDSSNLAEGSLINFVDNLPVSAEDMGAGIDGDEFACLTDGICGYSPAPGAGAGTDFSQFDGGLAGGLWTLCVGDRAGSLEGTLHFWELDLVSFARARSDETPVDVPDGDYVGTQVGNGFGPDSGMVCKEMSTSSGGAGALMNVVHVNVAMDSTFVGDLVLKIESPGGDIVGLMSRPGAIEAADDGMGAFGDDSDLVATDPVNLVDASFVSAEDMGLGLGGNQAVCRDGGSCSFSPDPGSISALASFGAVPAENLKGRWTFCAGDAADLESAVLHYTEMRWLSVGPDPDVIFGDGFESGDLAAWASTSP